MPQEQALANLGDVERTLRNEDVRGASGDPGVGRDPSGVPAHHLADQHAIVGFGGGVEPVDCIDRDLHGGVKAEGDLGAGEVVVDRLRHADDRHPTEQLLRHAQGILAADRDQGVDAEPRDRRLHLLGPPLHFERIRPRGPQDRPPARQDPSRPFRGERNDHSFQHAAPSVGEAGDFIAVTLLAFAHDRPDHRVQAGRIPSSCKNSDPHARCLLQFPRCPTGSPQIGTADVGRRSINPTARRRISRLFSRRFLLARPS